MYIHILTIEDGEWFKITAILDDYVSEDFMLCKAILGYFPWEG